MAQLFDFNEKQQNENVLFATGIAQSLLRQIQWCYSDQRGLESMTPPPFPSTRNTTPTPFVTNNGHSQIVNDFKPGNRLGIYDPPIRGDVDSMTPSIRESTYQQPPPLVITNDTPLSQQLGLPN